MAELGIEIQLFLKWAHGYPEPRSGEWECAYDGWNTFYEAVFAFLRAKPEYRDWSTQEMRDILYVLARDNEMEHIAEELRIRQPELLVPITEAALIFGERDARWQLAKQIGQLGKAGGIEEQLLQRLAKDEHEYVRRRALLSLARLGSSATEHLAIEAWHRIDEHQEWSRMAALSCLFEIGSPQFETLLAEAERDERPYLSGLARRLRNGEGVD